MPDSLYDSEYLRNRDLYFCVISFGIFAICCPEVLPFARSCATGGQEGDKGGMRETHDWFRRPGSFDAMLDAIQTINRSGMRSVVMSTVSAENIDEIPDVIDAVMKREVGIFAFGRYVPNGGGLDAGIEPLCYRGLLDVCHKKFTAYRQAGCKTRFSRKDHLWTLYDWEEGLLGDFRGGSHFAFSEGWLPDVSAGRLIYSPCHGHLLPITGYQGGSHFLATNWLPPESAEKGDFAGRCSTG